MRELAHVIEIPAPEIDEQDVMARIQTRIPQRRAQAEAQGLDYDRLVGDPAMTFSAGLYYDLYLACTRANDIEVVLSLEESSLVTGITRFVLTRRGMMVTLRATFVGQIGMVLMGEGNRIIDLHQLIHNNLFRDIFRFSRLFLRTRAGALAFPGRHIGV